MKIQNLTLSEYKYGYKQTKKVILPYTNPKVKVLSAFSPPPNTGSGCGSVAGVVTDADLNLHRENSSYTKAQLLFWRQLISVSCFPASHFFNSHYSSAISLQVFAEKSESSMQTTGNPDNLIATKETTERLFLVQHRLCKQFYPAWRRHLATLSDGMLLLQLMSV